MQITISPSEADEIIKKIETGHIGGVTLEQYLQVSFLSLMSGDEIHFEGNIAYGGFERNMVYGGSVFKLHACVEQINPGQQVSALRKIV